MKDCRETWYDPQQKVSVTLVDVTEAATALVRGHLAGPTSGHFLTRALAAAALLGAETSEPEETLIVQMKCTGPLGGFNVECTAAGTLRGYTERKILDDFDGLGAPDPKKVVGDCRLQITRSVPGRILSQGIAASLDGYLADSLQRRACIRLEAAVTDELEIREARGALIEALPDGAADAAALAATLKRGDLATASRTLLKKLGLRAAELRKTEPLRFACRCSPERAVAMLRAMTPAERADLPPTLDVTCHMCGKIFTVKTEET